MEPEWKHIQTRAQRSAWEQVLRPLAAELVSAAPEMSVDIVRTIGERLPDLLSDQESLEANRASTEASILGFAEVLERGADPETASLGTATLAYAQEGVQRGVPVTTLIRSYRLGHAGVWERIAPLISKRTSGEQLVVATELCSAWLFAYVDAALCAAEDFYSAQRERWVRSTAATRAETIDTILHGDPIDQALASRRLGYELGRQHTAVIAWLQAHEEGRDTHSAMEAAIRDIAEQIGATRMLLQPIGILSMAAWLSTPEAPSDRRLDDLRFDMHNASGVRIATGEPAYGIAGFRDGRHEAAEARRVAELARRPPGTITRYASVALSAIATADLTHARTFVTRQLKGLADEDDVSARLAGTLRTYLDEHSSRSRTAKRLGIHENTVSYRIKQAEDILGRSVDQRTLELRVALALANLVRHQTD